MTILQAAILGLVQGITEFLPISSTAHLLILPKILKWPEPPLVFDTSLHLGTAIAVLVCFSKDFLVLFFKDRRTLLNVLIASISVMGIGMVLKDSVEMGFGTILWISFFLLAGSVVMLAAEFYSRRSKQDAKLNLRSSLIIGISQALALLPGISRSGITISTGLFCRLGRRDAARFSFLLSTPAIAAAGFYKLITSFSEISTLGYIPWLVGVGVSALSGFLAISFLLDFFDRRGFAAFVAYRLFLVGFLLIYTASGKLAY